MSSYPLVLALPNGVRAQLVIGSAADGQPCYEIDGEPTEIDVRIPDDLTANWCWNDSWLSHKDRSIQIDSASSPPPGWPAVRHTRFESARIIEATSAAIDAEAKARRAKKMKRPVRERIVAVPGPELQLEMEL